MTKQKQFTPWEIEQARLQLRSWERAMRRGESPEKVALDIETAVQADKSLPDKVAVIVDGLVVLA